jgi:putative membrane protein
MIKKDFIHINWEKLIQLILMMLLFNYFMKIINDNSISKYLNPKFNIFVFLSMVFLIIAILVHFKEIFSMGKSNIFKLKYFAFAFLLFIMYISPAKSIANEIADLRGVKVGNDNTVYNESIATTTTSIINNTDNLQVKEKNNPTDNSIDQEKGQLENVNNNAGKLVSIHTKNFLYEIDQIYSNPKNYENSKVNIQGFVFISDEFDKDTFAIARLGIVCCSADAQPLGMICKYSKRFELIKKKWYEINGIIRYITNKAGEKEPYIDVIDYLKLDEHEDDFVYMNSF